MDDETLTTREAASRFGVVPATIRKWASLGHIHPTGIDRSGRKLYRLTDLAVREKATRRKAGRRT